MPTSLIVIGIGALTGGLSAAIASTSILAGALIGGGLAALNYLLAPKPPTLGSQRADTRHTVQAAVSPARWIVGRARVGGVLVFYKETNDGQDLHLALVLSEGACDQIERLWVDGEEVELVPTDRTGDGESGRRLEPQENSTHRDKLTIYEYFRADGTEGDSLRTAVAEGMDTDAQGEWTTAHRLTGLSWVHVHLHQPKYGNNIDNRFWARTPELNFLVKGLKLTWPGQTAPTWTENAAAIRYWWLRTRRGLPAAAIDAASFRAAHSLCGETIHFSLPTGYEDYATSSMRYAVNGVIHADDDPERVEAELDFAWAGWAVELDGVYHFLPGADRPIARAITPDDIIAIEGIQPAPALQDRINAATLSLAQSREHDWLEASLPEFADTAAEARDGERLPQDLGTRPFVADPIAGGRLLAIALRRARASATFTYRVKPGPNLEWLAIRPSDWVNINDPEHGLESFQALVTRTVVNPDWSVTLDLVEQPAGVYADTLVLPGIKPRRIDIPTFRVVPAVTGLRLSYSYTVSRDGTIYWHISATWDAAPHLTRLVLTGPPTTIDPTRHAFQQTESAGIRHVFTVDAPGEYTVEARHVTRGGFASPGVSEIITFDWSDVPVPAPVVLSAEQYGSLVQIVIAPVANRDVTGVEVRYTRGPIDGAETLATIDEAGWLAASRADVAVTIPPSRATQPFVGNMLVPATGRYRLFCRLVNRVGNLSPITEIGYKLLLIPAVETLSPQQWPLWLGTLNHMYVWPRGDQFLLLPDRSRAAPTRAQWDGDEGWPFGQVEGYGAALSEDGSTWYETAVIDLGDLTNVDVTADLTHVAPPGAAVVTQTEHAYYVYHHATSPARASMTRTTIAGVTRLNAVRYLVFRVHLTTWRGAALSRFSPEIRRLT